MLTDYTTIEARAVVIATGARYRSLPLDRWAEFEGAGIYFAATELEARSCGPDPVAVIGGANSAAQAALYLAGRGNAVTLIVRGNDLSARYSSGSPRSTAPC
jgi:thioredoxin reductase (NADPH)